MTVKVPVVAPAAIVVVVGTVAEASLDVRPTLSPPVGAGPFSVIVPVEDAPPRSDVGLRTTVVTTGALTVRAALTGVPSFEAAMLATVSVPTAFVVTVKVPVVAPAANETDAGTVAAALSDASAITTPPAGAGSFNVIVPVEVPPPRTDVGLRVTLPTYCVLTIKLAVLVEAFTEAVITEVTVFGTFWVVIVTVPEVAPAAIAIEDGLAIAFWVPERPMVNPPTGAAELIVIVPVVDNVPRTVVGLRVKPVIVGALTVRVSWPVEELADPVIVTAVSEATARVVTVAVPVVAPAAIVRVAGTVAAAELDVRATG